MLRRRLSSVAALLVAGAAIGGALLLGPAGPAAAAGEPIGAGQYFAGVVNGVRGSATVTPIVRTICAGPISPGRVGTIAAGQTVSVVRTPKGPGYTGLFNSVSVWFVPPTLTPAPQQMRLTAYGVPAAIPTTIQVPCSGTGQVEFSACPYLAPCAFGWVPTRVTVRFLNIAV